MELIESSTVTEPGLYRMSAAAYHAGPCLFPELSSSIAKVIVQQSPLHAWTVHPKLGRAPSDDEDEGEESSSADNQAKKELLLGQAIHKVALGHGAEIHYVNPMDHVGPKGGVPKGWTNASIKARRDEILSTGGIPLLTKYRQGVNHCAANLRTAVEDWMCCGIEECLREVVICWEEKGFWRKAMIDIARHDLTRLGDLKTTRISIAPESAARHLYAESMEIQAAFYTRGCDAVDPDNMGRRQFAFFFGEQAAPYQASAPILMSEGGMELGRIQVARAINLWDSCLETGHWPGYDSAPYLAEPPAWKLQAIGFGL